MVEVAAPGKSNTQMPQPPVMRLRRQPQDPGLNPRPAYRVGDQRREARFINVRVALRNTETWAEGALAEVKRLKAELKACLIQREAGKMWQTAYLPSTCTLPRVIRMDDMEMMVHARRAENMRCWERRVHPVTFPEAPPFPSQGVEKERWCLFCCKSLVTDWGGERRPVHCDCMNTRRYGTMEIDTYEGAAGLLMEKFWSCQTFAEAQEFLLPRLHARSFAQDLQAQTTLVAGLAVDRWPVHMKYVHKEKLRRQGFPMESLVGRNSHREISSASVDRRCR